MDSTSKVRLVHKGEDLIHEPTYVIHRYRQNIFGVYAMSVCLLEGSLQNILEAALQVPSKNEKKALFHPPKLFAITPKKFLLVLNRYPANGSTLNQLFYRRTSKHHKIVKNQS